MSYVVLCAPMQLTRCRSERLDGLPPEASDLKFGNDVYHIRFDDRVSRPIYGHRYNFFLKDAVEDVPEYVVHWEPFVQYVLVALYRDPLCGTDTSTPLAGSPRSTTSSRFTRRSSTRCLRNFRAMMNSNPCCSA